MLNKLPTWIAIGGIAGIVYAGGLADKQVQEKCANLPVGMAQVCGFIQAPQSASTIFWTGLVGGSGAGTLAWFLVKSGKLNSRNIAYSSTAISLGLAVYSMTGGAMPNASASNAEQVTSVTQADRVTDLTPRRNAFLTMIAYAEGTFINGEIVYDMKFGGERFTDFSRHPEKVVVKPGGSKWSSDAAGFSQFLSTTFNPLKARHPKDIPDFTPLSQRNATLHLLNELGILPLIDRGNTAEAINKACKTWASFPCENGKGFYGQGIKSLPVLIEFHDKKLKEYGG